jgi:hypothetical protein
LKRANIKVREDSRVKVLDFGLAESDGTDRRDVIKPLVGADITTPAMNQMGIILGNDLQCSSLTPQ